MVEAPESASERKFRNLVQDLMTMETPRVVVECQSSSKARKLRRMFYHYTLRIADMEKKFLDDFKYSLQGARIIIEPKADWQPKEAGVENVSNSEGSPSGSN